jgi:protein-tyrosine-phosphatase
VLVGELEMRNDLLHIVFNRRFSLLMNQNPPCLTVVCTANVCRSPMAGALLRHALAAEPEPLSLIPVETAGVAAYGGEPATDYSVDVLKKVGIDIKEHRSQRLSPQLVDRSAFIFVMTNSHRDIILDAFPAAKGKVHLFREFMKGESDQIPDPFGSGFKTYEASRDSMVEAIPSLLAFLRKHAHLWES